MSAILCAEAARIVETLGLMPHPEGGFFQETHRSTQTFEAPQGQRALSTCIYYLLPAGTFSAFHRVTSDEIWHHYDGDPIDLHRIDERAGYSVSSLGRDLGRGERPQQVVRGGVWQAAVTRGDRFTLCGCTVSPGFDFADFEMPSRATLCARFPEWSAAIEALTRA